MRFEELFFRRRVPDPARLEQFGFQRIGEDYRYETLLREGSFQAVVEVRPEGSVKGTLIDLEFGDEFYQIHTEAPGAFAAKLKEEYGALLERLARECFLPQPFLCSASNRLALWIRRELSVEPEFTFDKYPGIGVFRHPGGGKWFAILMDVELGKLKDVEGNALTTDAEEKKRVVEILNVKIDPATREQWLARPGCCQAYHMNKKSWVSVRMDRDFPEEEVMAQIRWSFETTRGRGAARRKAGTAGKDGEPKSWLMPANVYQYDVPAAFARSPIITWKHGERTVPGDLVYLYFSAPVSAIRYQCRVTESNIDPCFTDEELNKKGARAMKIQLIREFDPPVPLAEMREYGVGPVRGPRFLPEDLEQAIQKRPK